jgi:hypothetical protein
MGYPVPHRSAATRPASIGITKLSGKSVAYGYDALNR